jgi:cobalt-zinc-cadmium efflux system membrane fusion protein
MLLFSTLILFAASCSSNKNQENKTVPDEVGVPPSLQDSKKNKLVKLTSQQQNELRIETFAVKTNVEDYVVFAPGVVFPAPTHASIISTPIDGQIREINKNEGDWVQKGEALFHIQSLEYGNLVSEYLQAYAEEQFQTNRLKRIKQLVEETISSVSELERATAEFERASASVRAAYAKMKALGVFDEEIKTLTTSGEFDPVLHIHAPISGIVEKNFVELGQSVNALENLSRILDTRVVLVRGYVSPDDARLIQTGDSIFIMRRDETLSTKTGAVISSVNPGLDENSRSVVVNILVSTSKNWPRPGENVRLEIVSSSQKEVIAIPVEALAYDGNQPVVFVQQSDDVFEKRTIRINEIGPRFVFVGNGLKEGEQVAVSKVFSLKALSRYDIIAEE